MAAGWGCIPKGQHTSEHEQAAWHSCVCGACAVCIAVRMKSPAGDHSQNSMAQRSSVHALQAPGRRQGRRRAGAGRRQGWRWAWTWRWQGRRRAGAGRRRGRRWAGARRVQRCGQLQGCIQQVDERSQSDGAGCRWHTHDSHASAAHCHQSNTCEHKVLLFGGTVGRLRLRCQPTHCSLCVYWLGSSTVPVDRHWCEAQPPGHRRLHHCSVMNVTRHSCLHVHWHRLHGSKMAAPICTALRTHVSITTAQPRARAHLAL